MRNKSLIRRYTRGLVHSIRDKEELGEIHGQLRDFLKFLREQDELDLALTSSLLPLSRKVAVAEDILGRLSLHPKTSRFVHLLVKNGRLGILEELVEDLLEVWNEEQGIQSFEVSSVVPLSEGQKKRLKEKLEHLERKPVDLKYKLEPALIGGLSLRQGNIIYDASLKGALAKLRESISEG